MALCSLSCELIFTHISSPLPADWGRYGDFKSPSSQRGGRLGWGEEVLVPPPPEPSSIKGEGQFTSPNESLAGEETGEERKGHGVVPYRTGTENRVEPLPTGPSQVTVTCRVPLSGKLMVPR